MDEILTFSECVTYVEENGTKSTIAAFNKYREGIDTVTRIRFSWGTVTAKSDRARCIRGAFHRITQDGLKEGRSSTKMDARYCVI